MATILKTKSIYFTDVNLIPTLGKVESRKQVPNEIFRVIVSPMLAVVGETFIRKAAALGLSVALPRFIDKKQKVNLFRFFEANKVNNNQLCFISLGLKETKEDLIYFHNSTGYHNSYLIEIANGYIPQLKKSIECISQEITFKNLMVGNVVTGDGVNYLVSNLMQFCDNLFIRVGIGNGRPCASSDVAAINRGQITELIECDDRKRRLEYLYQNKKIQLISDGSISKSGFAVKAFAAGADGCLIGSYFSKAEEAETHITGDGTYFGCASEKQNKLAGLDKHNEGKVIKIDKNELKPLEYLVKELWGGISSGVSYCGFRSVSELIGHGVFEVKQNSLPPKNRV